MQNEETNSKNDLYNKDLLPEKWVNLEDITVQ